MHLPGTICFDEFPFFRTLPFSFFVIEGSSPVFSLFLPMLRLCSSAAVFRLSFCLGLGLLSAWAPLAQARLGETLEQCQVRYGSPTDRAPFSIAGSDAEAYLFRKGDVVVRIHFHKGKAWHLAYREKFSEADTTVFLQANLNGDEWRPIDGEVIQQQRFWMSRMQRMSATFSYFKGQALMEVMTADCRKRLGEARSVAIRQAMRDSLGLRLNPDGKPRKAQQMLDLKGF
jgi:hypothetical protein